MMYWSNVLQTRNHRKHSEIAKKITTYSKAKECKILEYNGGSLFTFSIRGWGDRTSAHSRQLRATAKMTITSFWGNEFLVYQIILLCSWKMKNISSEKKVILFLLLHFCILWHHRPGVSNMWLPSPHVAGESLLCVLWCCCWIFK